MPTSNSRQEKAVHRLNLKCLITSAVITAFVMAIPSTALARKPRTSLTITAPSSVQAGETFSVSGRLRSSRTHGGIQGGRILFYFQGPGADEATRFASATTNRKGIYQLDLDVQEGGELTAQFPGTGRWRGSEATVRITAGSGSSNPGTTSLGDPTKTTTTMSQSRNGMIEGTQECLGETIQRSAPTVGTPTGSAIYAIDYLWVETAGGSFVPELSGDLYKSGTAGGRPVTAWEDTKTGKAVNYGAFGPMDTWSINPGQIVATIQYVWDDGAWYRSEENPA